MKYQFSEEKSEKVVNRFGNEVEDKTIWIDSRIEFSSEKVIEDCNIIFDVGKGAGFKTNKRLTFIDCEILFIGSSKDSVISVTGNTVSFDGCVFAQEDPTENILTNYVRGTGKGSIDVSGCKFYDLYGRFIQSEGMSVYVDSCEIENYVGEFCEVIAQINDNVNSYPSVKIDQCKFTNVRFLDGFVPDRFSNEYSDSGKMQMDYSGASRQSPYIIDIDAFASALLNNISFENCNMGCARVQCMGYPVGKCKINECTFIKSPTNIQKHGDGYSEDIESFNIYARCELDITNCKFVQARGVYAHAQYTKLLIENCLFDRCKVKNGFMDGILYIFNEVDEQCIDVNDCKFKKCKITGKFDESNTGMIYIVAGVPERKQEGSVIIKDCSYDDCEADKMIWGKERQDGIFGKMITFYREI